MLLENELMIEIIKELYDYVKYNQNFSVNNIYMEKNLTNLVIFSIYTSKIIVKFDDTNIIISYNSYDSYSFSYNSCSEEWSYSLSNPQCMMNCRGRLCGLLL